METKIVLLIISTITASVKNPHQRMGIFVHCIGMYDVILVFINKISGCYLPFSEQELLSLANISTIIVLQKRTGAYVLAFHNIMKGNICFLLKEKKAVSKLTQQCMSSNSIFSSPSLKEAIIPRLRSSRPNGTLPMQRHMLSASFVDAGAI